MEKQTLDHYYKQPLISKRNNAVWYLIDIVEQKSLLNPDSGTVINAQLFNPKTKKLKRVSYADLESKYTVLNSDLVEEVLKFNRLYNL